MQLGSLASAGGVPIRAVTRHIRRVLTAATALIAIALWLGALPRQSGAERGRRAISAAIFGNPNKIRYVSLSDAQRIPAVQSGKVDIVAHTMTIACARLRYVYFSTVYFNAAQRVLVLRNSHATDLADVLTNGGNACATRDSTALTNIQAEVVKRLVRESRGGEVLDGLPRPASAR